MSGNWETGMRSRASTPAKVKRTAMTTASRGRSTKTPEIILRLSARRRRNQGLRAGRAGVHFNAGADALDAIGDNHLAFRQAAGDYGGGGCGLPQLNAALFDLLILTNYIDVIALLIRQHRFARNAQGHHRLNAFDQHVDEGAIDQGPLDRLPIRGGLTGR